jgi:hypothetical protein
MQEQFWFEVKENVHDALISYVKDIEENQQDIHRSNLEHAKLYSNREFIALDWGMFARRANLRHVKPVTENVIQSVCDSGYALIAKNKPRVAAQTDGADFKLARQAELLEKFIAGVFYQNAAYDKTSSSVLHSEIFGSGFVFTYEDEGKICIEKVLPDEIIVDERACAYGEPFEMFRRQPVDKNWLKGMYPDDAEKIEEAASASWVSYRSPPKGHVILVEGWRLPIGKTPGRHVVCIEGCTFVDEEWTDDCFPIEKYDWSEPVIGYYGMGVAEQIAGIQLRINKLNKFIDRCQDLMAAPKYLLPVGSKIKPEHITNEPGTVLFYVPPGKPEVWTGQAVGVEIYERLRELKRSAYEIPGISQLSATSKKPTGLDSGAALREYNDIETERFAIQAQRYESFVMRIAKQVIRVAKKMYSGKNPKNAKIMWRGDDTVREINWSEVNMDENSYVLKLEPASMLSKTPAGRKQDVADLLSLQILGPEDKGLVLQMLGHPDPERYRDLETADHDVAEHTVRMILDGKAGMVPPDPMMNIQLTQKYCQNTYNMLRCKKNVDPAIMQDLRNWMKMSEQLLKGQMATQQAMDEQAVQQEQMAAQQEALAAQQETQGA